MDLYEKYDNKISDEKLAERFGGFGDGDDQWGSSVIKIKNSNKN